MDNYGLQPGLDLCELVSEPTQARSIVSRVYTERMASQQKHYIHLPVV